MPDRQMIETRVCIDDLGPFPAKVDPTNLWHGYISPHFTLDTVRELAATLQVAAEAAGVDRYETVHVIDGGPGSDGRPRAVVLVASWQFYDEGPKVFTEIVEPDAEGRYCVGDWEWAWGYAHWWCACGSHQVWHNTECPTCELTRDNQAEKKPCGCGCDPEQGVWGEYAVDNIESRAHWIRTGRFLRWSELTDVDPS